MSDQNEINPLNRWMADEITTGKFAELIGVKRHIADEICGEVWKLTERLKEEAKVARVLTHENQALRDQNAKLEFAASELLSWATILGNDFRDFAAEARNNAIEILLVNRTLASADSSEKSNP